jgi:HPt (histidine-containing phosphotransfer) domain-containing protein
LVERAIRTYFAIVPGLLAEIEREMEAGDLTVARRAAHSLKSSSAYLGLTEVSELARALEEHCAAGDRAAVKSGLPQLTRVVEAGNAALSEVVAAEACEARTERAAAG